MQFRRTARLLADMGDQSWRRVADTEKTDRDQQIFWDAGPWSIPIAHSYIHPTSILVTKVPESHDTTCKVFGAEGERYFAFDLNGDQFEDIIQRLQRRFPAVFPDHARDYYLNHINVQNEIFIPETNSKAWLSTTFRDVRVRLLGVK
jgi:hypothetical protein